MVAHLLHCFEQVLEVNAGSERTGALVTKTVGEATQSCRLAQAPPFPGCLPAGLLSSGPLCHSFQVS